MLSLAKSLLRAVFRLPAENCAITFGVRWRLLQLLGFNWHVPWPVHFTSTVVWPHRVVLGKATYPGDSPGCYIQALNGIEVGDRVNLAPNVGLISANHDPSDNSRWLPAEPIRLGADCWIGMNAVILPGVQLGPHTVVGAGAVVTKSFPEGHCIIAGNPARVIRQLNTDPTG
jgi:hypothetical protein